MKIKWSKKKTMGVVTALILIIACGCLVGTSDDGPVKKVVEGIKGIIQNRDEKSAGKSEEEDSDNQESEKDISDEEYATLTESPNTVIVEGLNKGGSVSEGDREFGLADLPYQIPDADLQITAIGNYSGPFVEDGKDEEVTDILSIVIKNTSSQMIQYGNLYLQMAGGDKACFEFTSIPGNASVLVLESEQKSYPKSESFLYKSCSGSYQKNASLHEEAIALDTTDGNITAKNLTESKLSDVYVYYKYIDEDSNYVGGITYRVSIGELAPGESRMVESGHYAPDSSQILMVDYLNE